MSYALITGASRGIGLAIAAELAQRKYNLLLVARSGDQLQALARQLAADYQVKVDFLAVDLSNPAAPQQVVDWCKGNNYEVGVLVNNAGYGLSGQFEQYSLSDNLAMMQVNMTSLVQLTQLLLPELRRQTRGYVLNIASSTAYQALPGMSLYAATKVFVLNFSRGLHHELAGTSVSVTCISPGATDTGFNDRAQINAKAREAAKKITMTPEAVARQSVAAMLAGKAEVITGGINKLGAFAAWLLPKGIVEKTAYKIYKES
ncbi:SDR family NAD(P)-dependent oxidoreductase [Fibrivirga algicola]|uniref:SDR family oxidoreductase n=1 Tax=Fibrivirga algicola TaxID=2950420 RepID=A0ABX0QDZ5_9BACT|nr:SDR family oxidoreductase [Fibrivirga algicola]ARK13000.1 short-chain dehydrogenase [Fibrella sp. ES10-3-2-2]NID09435.1 SDR family oxidoreductase [Fibrivirga algicola]